MVNPSIILSYTIVSWYLICLEPKSIPHFLELDILFSHPVACYNQQNVAYLLCHWNDPIKFIPLEQPQYGSHNERLNHYNGCPDPTIPLRAYESNCIWDSDHLKITVHALLIIFPTLFLFLGRVWHWTDLSRLYFCFPLLLLLQHVPLLKPFPGR